MQTLQNKMGILLALALISSPTLWAVEKNETASWYSKSAPGVGTKTANGEKFDDKKLTCATKHDKFGTHLKVTNVKNGKSVICRVNDRGPHKRLKKRRVDLTKTAFKQIADSKHGLAQVSVKKVSSPKKKG